MTSIAHLTHRGLISLTGPDWAPFLKGLCTAPIDELAEASAQGQFHKLCYGAFLRPQGKMICDVLLHCVSADEIWLDVPFSERDELLAKLNMYRLRAQVTLKALDRPAFVAFGSDLPEGFLKDPRCACIGADFGFSYSEQDDNDNVDAWAAFRMARGLSDPGYDFPKDDLYAIDANLDLLGAIDFHKGCYVGQELTSRMKRRGQIKNRILAFRYRDAPPQAGEDILHGDKRAGTVLNTSQGLGLGLMRLDRLGAPLSHSHGAIDLLIPDWMAPHLLPLKSE